MKGPNIVFDVSRVFHRHFVYHRDIEPAELQKLNLFKDEIEKTFRGGEREIMGSLEKTFGPTTENEIRVWIVDDKMRTPTISKPLLLKYKKNKDLALYILVHELAHRYLDAGVRWKGKKSDWLQPGIKLEALCHFAAERALGRDFAGRLYNELIEKISNYGDAKAFIEKNTAQINEFLGERQ